MSTLQQEYIRFMRWLGTTESDPDVKRVAKIIEGDLGRIAASSSAGGQRAGILAPLLSEQLPSVDDQISTADENIDSSEVPWTRLRRLLVGPFRGFRREEEFDLKKDIVLFYGPNGSGKTSLCEAIEYALVGDVEDATAKRIASLPDYFNNIHEGRHTQPRLFAACGQNEILVEPNADLLQFAIIEKNRIEGFARMAARPPAQASAIIATLFGMDSFNDFVNSFTNSIDTRLQLSKINQTALDLKLTERNNARQRIDASNDVLAGFMHEQEQIAATYQEDCTFEQLARLLGLSDHPGRLQEITNQLDEQLPPKSELRVREIFSIRRELSRNLKELEECRELLRARADQVSFRGLYRAVQELEPISPESCPACETPLESLVANPYSRAAQGLLLLKDLADIESRKDQIEQEANELSRRLRDIAIRSESFGPNEKESIASIINWAHADGSPPIWTQSWISKESWRAFSKFVRKIEQRDFEIELKHDARRELIQERGKLAAANQSFTELVGRRNQHLKDIEAEQSLIDSFAEVNADLIAAVAQENVTFAAEQRISVAYGGFIEVIRQYRDDLPARLMADLNHVTRDLYNQFNADDHDGDKLAEISLPTRGGSRITVAFNSAPDQMHDALNVLSEGHLRCLGLAILLAKNIKLNLPLLVFDDAVNAIDHDHRAGIRSTIFGDPRIRAKQILITCHSNEFIKDIQNQLGGNVSKLYTLDNHVGDHQPQVRDGTDRNYLLRAQNFLAEGDQRQCLAFSRQSLEHLASRTWRALGNQSGELGALSVQLRSAAARPELGALTRELKRKIEQGREIGTLRSAAWEARHEGYSAILQVPNSELIWSYFNKGTHDEEDREDFEIQAVRAIVAALNSIDASFNS